MTEQTTSAAPAVWPALFYRDAEAALGYLVEVLGFTESVVHRGGPERPIAHAELRWPEGGGVMFGSEPHQRWSGAAGAPGTATVYLATDRVDEIAARAEQAGWTILRPLAETEYGSRECALRDPEGNAWSVGTYRGADG